MNTASAVSKHAMEETKACVYKIVHYQPLYLMQQVNWLILESISEVCKSSDNVRLHANKRNARC